MRFNLEDTVYKRGTGYEGPGVIKAIFKTWMGDHRFVVEHRIAGGRGFFYHIYSAKELERTDQYAMYEKSEWPAVRGEPSDRE